ncbi:hypothetical protein [Amantichitinum ursilacus]|uniref:Uncharacterized protein n=1 Tax=Amantichitinum ursilacus TaxID=857265 RepID=A0A0N0GRI6_9NEIS|nr:hypothetical protein [Amantichitinum ursilacus]KPC55459.1 hypothetical protein WG78_02340 [Amantichitinum ursilacus]
MLNATSSPALTYTPASLQAEALAYQPPSSKPDTPATSRLPPATPTEDAAADQFSGGQGGNLQAAIAQLNQGSGGWISVKKSPDLTVALTVVSANGQETGFDDYQRGSVLHTSV